MVGGVCVLSGTLLKAGEDLCVTDVDEPTPPQGRLWRLRQMWAWVSESWWGLDKLTKEHGFWGMRAGDGLTAGASPPRSIDRRSKHQMLSEVMGGWRCMHVWCVTLLVWQG